MQFTLRTLFLLFIVLWSSLAAFGILGIVVTAFCLLGTKIFIDARVSRRVPIMLSMFVFAGMVAGQFAWIAVPGESLQKSMSICRYRNLKNIGLALHEYHDTHGCFPPVCVTDGNGQSLHSWRMLIPPSGLDRNTYDKYDFNEPWNSANNKPLGSDAGGRFSCYASRSQDSTATSYVAVTGPNTAWHPDRGVRLEDITDGPSKTALLVEMLDSNIHWMEPRDITLEEAIEGPDGKAGVPTSNHRFIGGYFFRAVSSAGHILMADGSVIYLYRRPSKEDFAALFSISGNEEIDIKKLTESDNPIRWDHVIGLPLFLVSVTWFWIRLLPKKSSPYGTTKGTA